jgi:CRP/FNR family cyclic AMP-dependent transcriptional regulator
MNQDETTSPSGQAAADESRSLDTIIAEHPFFAHLKPAHIQALQANAMRMTYEAGGFIFREGDPANRFYLIETGKVSLESHRQDEAPRRIDTIGAGDVLGWSWLFPPYYWHFDARAIEPTTAIFFYGTRLREHCEEDHEFGFELMKRVTAVVIKRLQSTRKQLLDRSV